ncbi:MAG: helix-turn-helix transcriptional regulator [Bilifractor sp.]|nr:helix-turn-helix domain-containing protein [Lachnospiraceae bacterium]MDY2836383.1 helix-turn-helix transcriptional regulator [Bilifractor sp.]
MKNVKEDRQTTDSQVKNYDFNFEGLGEAIKKLRIEKGLTQNEVATELHVTPGYISNVENSRTAMSIKVLCYFANICDITVDEILGRTIPEYHGTSLDNKLFEEIHSMSDDEKEKLLATIAIWKKK